MPVKHCFLGNCVRLPLPGALVCEHVRMIYDPEVGFRCTEYLDAGELPSVQVPPHGEQLPPAATEEEIIV